MVGRGFSVKAAEGFSDELLEQFCADPEHAAVHKQNGLLMLYLTFDDYTRATDSFKERLSSTFKKMVTKRAQIRSEPVPPTRVIYVSPPHMCEDYAIYTPLPRRSLVDQLDLGSLDAQFQSPIFQLPAELRQKIFAFATAEYEDWDNEYSPDDEDNPYRFYSYYRPSWYAPWIIDLTLLLTCRRVYYEASHLPAQQAVHRWYLRTPGPQLDRNSRAGYLGKVPLREVTPNVLQNITQISIQASASVLQGRNTALHDWEWYRGPDPFPNLENLVFIIPWAAWDGPSEIALDLMDCDDWPEVKNKLRFVLEVKNEVGQRRELEEFCSTLRSGKLQFTTINGTPLIPSEQWPSTTWHLEALEEHVGTGHNGYRQIEIKDIKTELFVVFCDFIPGRTPGIWEDVWRHKVYLGKQSTTDVWDYFDAGISSGFS